MSGVCSRLELSLGHRARMLPIVLWVNVLNEAVIKETSSEEVSFFEALMVLWTWIRLLMHWFISVILLQIWRRRISKSQVRRFSRYVDHLNFSLQIQQVVRKPQQLIAPQLTLFESRSYPTIYPANYLHLLESLDFEYNHFALSVQFSWA